MGRGERVTEVIYRGTRLDYNDDENKTGVDAGKGVAKNRDEVFREMEEVFGLVPGWVRKLPDVAIGEIWALVKGAQLGETHIPAKYKILIGVAVAAALRSPHCSYFGTEAAKQRGATEDEIREAVLVIPIVTSILSLVLLGMTVLAWKDGFWSGPGRLQHSCIVLAAMVFVLWVNYWNLLGWRY